MKKLLIITLLLISTNCYSAGPQKINYPIDGIKVGDSLKELYSDSEIKEFKRQEIKKDGKYYLLARFPSEAVSRLIKRSLDMPPQITKISRANAFSVIQFAVKEGDPDMYVYAVAAIRLHPSDINGCIDSKNSLIKNVIKKDFKYIKDHDSEMSHPTNEGMVYQSEFLLDYGNKVRVYCVNYKNDSALKDYLRFEILNKDYDSWYNK